MFRLDRLHEATGNVTWAFLPVLYKAAPMLHPPEAPRPLDESDQLVKDIIAPNTHIDTAPPAPKVYTPTPVPTVLPQPRKCNRDHTSSRDHTMLQASPMTPPTFDMLHRPFCFTSGEDIVDFVPSLSVPVQAALPYDSPRAAITDEEMECDFLSTRGEQCRQL